MLWSCMFFFWGGRKWQQPRWSPLQRGTRAVLHILEIILRREKKIQSTDRKERERESLLAMMTSNCRPRGRNKRSQNKENIVFYNYRAGSGSEYNINQGSCQLHMSQAKKLWHPSKEQQLEQDIWHWSLMFGALLYSPCSFQAKRDKTSSTAASQKRFSDLMLFHISCYADNFCWAKNDQLII